MDAIDFTMWLSGSVICVGLLEWVKSMIPVKMPWWVWTIASPALACLVALAGNSPKPFWDALGILAISEMSYQYILQTIKKKFTPKE